jgi:arylsulfatase
MPGFDPKAAPTPHILESTKDGKPRAVKVYNHKTRRLIDQELAERAVAFIGRNAKAGKPFFLYLPLTQVHWPTLCHPDFDGKSGAGKIGDAVTEMDHNVGRVIDAVARAYIERDTIVVFTSDNGPEYRVPWRGTAGPWRGTYHTAMEGSLRAPFLIRWPARIPAGTVSNEIVHIADLFTTLARACGAEVPKDRPIDGADQMPFFGGKKKSVREGFPCFVQGELYAVKWRDWKMHLVWYPVANGGAPEKLGFPKLFHLRSDPKEEMDVMTDNTWVGAPMMKIVAEFQASLKKYPPIRPGTPDPYRPPK